LFSRIDDMKLLVVAIFALLAVSALAMPVEDPIEVDWDNIDYSKVIPVQDMEGFWDGRDPRLVPSKEMWESRHSRIVGGGVVTPGAHPYQAGLLMAFGGGTGLCGGSFISGNRALTAAHCPIGSSSTQVILGAHAINTVEPVQVRRTVGTGGYRLHASYNPSNLNNDIAILILGAPAIGTTARIQISALAPGGAGTFAGVSGTVSGWGRISDGSQATSATLRSATNTIITNAVCAGTFGGIIIASTICKSAANGHGTCNGDSGGPLTVAAGGGRQQVGVVSFGAAAGCQLGHPNGYARVSSFAAWIAGQN